MTYWIVAAVLTVILVVWLVQGNKSSTVVDAMDAAIRDGDEELLSHLLKSAPDVARNINDVTFLLVKAVCHNRENMVRELLDLGHSGRDIQQCALMHEVDVLNTAIKESNPDVLRILMVAGMVAEQEYASPMLCCYVLGRPEHLRVLKMFDALTVAEGQNEKKLSRLHAVALCYEDNAEVLLQMAKDALKEGDDVNAFSLSGNTPLDFAMDTTHEGAGDRSALQKLLLRYGAKTGRSLRVPCPGYQSTAYFAEQLPDLSAVELPDGVQIEGIDAPDTRPLPVEDLEEKCKVNEDLAQLCRHSAHVRVSVQGKQGEDPLEVGRRMFSVLLQMVSLPGFAGLSCSGAVAPASSCVTGASAPEVLYPMLYTEVKVGKSEGVYVINTSGLAEYGLQEVELLIDDKTLTKKKVQLASVIHALVAEVVSGTAAWEDGHTIALNGVLCEISLGDHVLTKNRGLVFGAYPGCN